MSPDEKRHSRNAQVSIIIPTYNESQNILKILRSIGENLPPHLHTEAIVVDDNSPDGTGKVVEHYLQNVKKVAGYTIDVIHRTAKKGLSSAILKGIQHANGDTIVIMDSDFSHPPQIIPRMLDALKKYQCDIVVASRYVKGGKIQGWSLKRKLMSKLATVIAKKGLGVGPADPMSGFFAFKHAIIKGLKFDAIGFKMLLEVLVKTKGVTVKEIPYTFTDRRFGSSKVTIATAFDYATSVWKLYRYNARPPGRRTGTVRTILPAARRRTRRGACAPRPTSGDRPAAPAHSNAPGCRTGGDCRVSNPPRGAAPISRPPQRAVRGPGRAPIR